MPKLIKAGLAMFVLGTGVAPAAPLAALNPAEVKLQIEKELAVAAMLKAAMTCQNDQVLVDGSLYCFVKFRGLDLEFAGMNAKSGGTIYVKGMGKNQMLSATGRRCLTVQFSDPDLVGRLAASEVIVRDDGTITHNFSNVKGRAACE